MIATTTRDDIRPRCRDTGLPGMSARQLWRLMRVHKVTIRELARRTGYPQWAIRQRRKLGVSFLGSLDCWQAITGAAQLDARRSAQLKQWHALRASGEYVRSFDEEDWE